MNAALEKPSLEHTFYLKEPTIIIGERQSGKTRLFLESIRHELNTTTVGDIRIVVYCRDISDRDYLQGKLGYLGRGIEWRLMKGTTSIDLDLQNDADAICYFHEMLVTHPILQDALMQKIKTRCNVVIEMTADGCQLVMAQKPKLQSA